MFLIVYLLAICRNRGPFSQVIACCFAVEALRVLIIRWKRHSREAINNGVVAGCEFVVTLLEIIMSIIEMIPKNLVGGAASECLDLP